MGESRLMRLNAARFRSRALMVVVLCTLLAACEYPSDAVRVENQSSQTVRLFDVTDAGSRLDLGTLSPGEDYADRRECVASLVVESPNGEELAVFEGTLCQGDPPWTITDELLEGG